MKMPQLITVGCVVCGMPCQAEHTKTEFVEHDIVRATMWDEWIDWVMTCDCPFWDHVNHASYARRLVQLMDGKVRAEVARLDAVEDAVVRGEYDAS